MLLIRGFFIEKSKVNLDFKRSNNMYMYYLDILCFVYWEGKFMYIKFKFNVYVKLVFNVYYLFKKILN